MKLCKTHITQLIKVRNALAIRQKMNGTQLLLSTKNKKYMDKALRKIEESMNLLNQII